MNRLLIVDGHAYAYRAFHAIRGMRSPTGEPTNAIFGFIKMLIKMRGLLSPTHSMVVWDGGLSTERVAALPGYKAQRPEMPVDLASQIDEIIGYLTAASIASYCEEGVEADDYIACLARCATGADLEVVIASSDKDFMQLVTLEKLKSGKAEKRKGATAPADFSVSGFQDFSFSQAGGWIGLFNPNDKSEMIWGAEQVRNKTGVEPSQMVDWLALVGDSVDNIPGVPGVGPKTAADLLRQFGSIEELYRRLSEIKSDRLRAALESSVGNVRRNQELVRLKADLPCDFSLEHLGEKPGDAKRLATLYRRWGFRSLLAEVVGEQEQVRQAGQELQAALL